MAQAITLARPYARAAFELAQEKGTLAEWSQALGFSAGVAADPSVSRIATDPRFEPGKLVSLYLPEGMTDASPFARFIDELAEHGRLRLLPEIAALFEALKRESEMRLRVKITSARALDDDESMQLKTALKRRYRREIELETRVDESLLGGVLIDAGGEVIDGSARARLQRLASTLAR